MVRDCGGVLGSGGFIIPCSPGVATAKLIPFKRGYTSRDGRGWELQCLQLHCNFDLAVLSLLLHLLLLLATCDGQQPPVLGCRATFETPCLSKNQPC